MLAVILDQQGQKGVDIVKAAISKYSATGESADSVEYTSDDKSLQILAREFISAMETGRGPRKSNSDGGFKDKMLRYMQVRGIGSDLDAKKKEALAKFLVLRINKEGDKLFKKGGGRDVYTKALEKFTEELTKAVTDYQMKVYTDEVIASLKDIK
jgi:hypothetical protein